MDGAVITLPGTELAGWAEAAARHLFAMLRVGAFLVSAPGFSARFVPLPVRIIAAAALALPVTASADMPAATELATLQAVPMILAELAIGLCAGLVLTVIFGAAAMAGDQISNAAGLGFAAQFDPTAGSTSPVVAQIFALSLLFVMFALDGHLAALRIVLDSYVLYPPGSSPDLAVLAAAGIGAGAAMFALAATIMLPVVTGLVLMNLAIGVITRSAPQMNVFSVGFPLGVMAALVLLWLTVPAMMHGLAGINAEGLDRLEELFGAHDG